jgi:hypothetical protein
MGLPMGQPGDSDGQRAVLRAVLENGWAMTEPRSYAELPCVWPEPRSKAIREPVQVLFEIESAPDDARILRIDGTGVVRTDAPMMQRY